MVILCHLVGIPSRSSSISLMHPIVSFSVTSMVMVFPFVVFTIACIALGLGQRAQLGCLYCAPILGFSPV